MYKINGILGKIHGAVKSWWEWHMEYNLRQQDYEIAVAALAAGKEKKLPLPELYTLTMTTLQAKIRVTDWEEGIRE